MCEICKGLVTGCPNCDVDPLDPERVYILLHETVLESWLKDFGSIGSLAGLIAVNHHVGNGSGWVDAIGALLLLVFMIARSSARRRAAPQLTRDELRAFAERL